MVELHALQAQRAWARLAGLMYWLVLLVDLTGMQLTRGNVGRSLLLAGSLLTVPLALGLFFALRPVGPTVATCALALRLLEAALGSLSVLAGFASLHLQWAGSHSGSTLLGVAHWDHRTNFAAFVFTVGSTLFFILFVRSRYIPAPLAWWGLFASVVALFACSAHLVRPTFPAMTMYAWVPMLLAETSTGLWLLLRSVRVQNHLGSREPAAPVQNSGVSSL